VASRVQVAASACFVASGLFMCGLGGALAVAEPPAPPGTPGGTHSNEVLGGSIHDSLRLGHGDDSGKGPKGDSDDDDGSGPSNGEKGDGDKAENGDENGDGDENGGGSGNGGNPGNGNCGNDGSNGNAQHCGGGSSTQTTKPSETETTKTTTRTTSSRTTTTRSTTSSETPATETTEATTPTNTTPTPPGLPATGGGGGGGGGGALEPPSGRLEPPQMQVSPHVGGEPAGPSVVSAAPGLGVAAAELPLAPITLPVIVAPVAGIGGGAAPAAPARPSLPEPPRAVTAEPPAGRKPLPASVGSNVAVPASSYRTGYAEYLRTAGMSQVAALAVPGVAGMLVLTGAGGLVGYRQAKAGHAVRTGGAARFVN
jgi:hypothetical protein